MKLEDFVSETLTQLFSGVRKAQKQAAEYGGEINPGSDICEPITPVAFDVAVTTVDDSETKGAVGVFVGPVGLGSQGKSGTTNTSESRIKFEVPVALPAQRR